MGFISESRDYLPGGLQWLGDHGIRWCEYLYMEFGHQPVNNQPVWSLGWSLVSGSYTASSGAVFGQQTDWHSSVAVTGVRQLRSFSTCLAVGWFALALYHHTLRSSINGALCCRTREQHWSVNVAMPVMWKSKWMWTRTWIQSKWLNLWGFRCLRACSIRYRGTSLGSNWQSWYYFTLVGCTDRPLYLCISR